MLLAGETGPVRTLALASLPAADGRALLQDRGLQGTDQHWAALHARYSGNPLALQIVAETIREIFAGDIAQFLAQDMLLFRGIVDLLERQFNRLTPLEQEVMFWLAVAREPVTPEKLGNDIVAATSRLAILKALHSLRQCSLVERVQGGFTLQNVVLEYVTTTLVEQVSAEICSGAAVLLQRIALLQASAKSYVRESQRNLILQPAAQRLVEELGQAALLQQMRAILAYLRQHQARQPGYAAGNILNLLVQLGVDLRGQDFSQLAVCRADLREVTTQDVDFNQAGLSHSPLTDVFADILCVASTPDGRRLAGGTMSGEIRIWRVSDGKALLAWTAPPGIVWSVNFSPDGRILASCSADQTVRLWDASDGRHLATLRGHRDDVHSVSFSPDSSTLASGGADRTVRLWDRQSGECLRTLQGHTDWVRSVCFSPDGGVLASASGDQTVRLWDRYTGECLHTLQGHTTPLWSVWFSSDGTLVGGGGGGDMKVRLWDRHTGECLHTLQGDTGRVWSICYSPDGNVLASCGDEPTVRLWDPSSGQCLHVLRGMQTQSTR